MAAGCVLFISGAMLKITGLGLSVVLYCAGAVLFACAMFADRYKGDNVTVRRLRAQQVTGAVFMLVSALQMYCERLHPYLVMDSSLGDGLKAFVSSATAPNSWIVTMCVAALFELYSSIRLEQESRRDNKKE